MIQIYSDPEATSRAAAELFTKEAQQAIRTHGRFTVSLAGGQTPKRIYELLAQPPFATQVPWGNVHVFWGDERYVPADDPRSNARMASQALLDHVPIPKQQIHPIAQAYSPHEAAEQYEAALRQHFGQEAPRFDLVLLGLGDNGHTASLFPDTPVLREQVRWVAEVYVAEQDMYRVTLTAPLLNQAALIAFVVTGSGKADVLPQVIEGAYEPQRLPAQLIKPAAGQLLWLLDRSAAVRLKASTISGK